MLTLFILWLLIALVVWLCGQPKPQRRQHSRFYDWYIHYSPEWKAKRLEKFRSVGFRCGECGSVRPPWQLDCHHLNYERLGHERLSDLEATCRGACHDQADARRRARKRA